MGRSLLIGASAPQDALEGVAVNGKLLRGNSKQRTLALLYAKRVLTMWA
jgi:hypothetical protein